jgi:ATP-binding cassette subfamily F protein uup
LSACTACRRTRSARRLVVRGAGRAGHPALLADPDAKVGTLSGGQKKRLALAQALAVAPECCCSTSRPTTSTSAPSSGWKNLLIESGVTLVFITHDRRFLDRVATRIVELDRGKLLFSRQLQPSTSCARKQMLHDEALANAAPTSCWRRKKCGFARASKARRTRNEGRVLRLEQLRASAQARRERQGKVELRSMPATRAASWWPNSSTSARAFGDAAKAWCAISPAASARRQDRPDRPQRRRQDDAAAPDPRRTAAGRGHGALGTKMEVAYFDQFRTAAR